MKYNILITILSLASFLAAACTPVEEPQQGEPLPEAPDKPVDPFLPDMDPEDEIGWYNAPWIRYEAEADAATGKCEWLSMSDNRKDVQCEATHHKAVNLVNKDDYIEWICKEAAEGAVIRFSLPDSPEGTGTKGNIALYVEDEWKCDIELDSYHAWQWKNKDAGTWNWYFDNTPDPSFSSRIARMYYDEERVLLNEKIAAGQKFRLVKVDDNAVPYTIDFVELEPVPEPLDYMDVMDGSTVCFDPEKDGDLGSFCNNNTGLTIFIPPGHYDLTWHFEIKNANTKLIGAGPWYTELHFTADPNDPSTINRRGIVGKESPDNCAIKNLYLDTDLERRYLNYHGSTGNNGTPPGKGINGQWGDNFTLDNVWINHFESGIWLDALGVDSKITRCRVRGCYADGMNINQGKNLVLSHCNSRNNGDDQIALRYYNKESESEEDMRTTVHHCTIELGWRAGGLAILAGGYNLDVHNILVQDHWENGMRCTSEFGYAGSDISYPYSHNITVSRIRLVNCGSRGFGNPFEYGGYSGDYIPAMVFSLAGKTPLNGRSFTDIEIVNPHSCGLAFGDSGKSFVDFTMKNVKISNWNSADGHYAIQFGTNSAGRVGYSNVVFEGDENTRMNTVPSTLTWEEIAE